MPGPRASNPVWIEFSSTLVEDNRLRALHAVDAHANPAVADIDARNEQWIRDNADISLAGRLQAIGEMHKRDRAARKAAPSPAETQPRAVDEVFKNLMMSHVPLWSRSCQDRIPDIDAICNAQGKRDRRNLGG